MKKIPVLLLILLAACFTRAQTAENPNYAHKLTPLTKLDEVRYKYGIRKEPRPPPHSTFEVAPCRSKIDFDTSVEFAGVGKGIVSVFYYSVRVRELVYERRQDKLLAMSDYFVRIRNAEKNIDGGFEGEVVDLVEGAVLAAGAERPIVIRKIVDLPPGTYRADTTFRDRTSGCRGSSSGAFTVPEFEKGNPILSTLILGGPLEPMAKEPPAEFRHYPLRMLPMPSGIFRQGERIAFGYLLAIPIADDCWKSACPNTPDDVAYQIEKNGKILMTFNQDWKHYKNAEDGRVITDFSTESLKPGKYTITVTVKERKTGKSFSQSDTFSITKKPK